MYGDDSEVITDWCVLSAESGHCFKRAGDIGSLAMVLTSVGLPVDGIALVAGVDRIFDMGRTVVNITGDASCCIIVSNMERKKDAKREIANGL